MINYVINNMYLKHLIIFVTNYICAIYIYTKLSISKNTTKKISLVLSSSLIPCLCTFLWAINFPFYKFVFVIITTISFWLIKKEKYYILIPIGVFSIGISYFLETVSIILLITPFYLFKYYDTNILTEICTSIIHFLLSFLFIKIKRIKHGFSFLQNKKNFGIGLLISGPAIIVTCIQRDYVTSEVLATLLFGVIISSVGLLLWLRSAITRYYRKRLKLRAEEYSKLELAEKSKEIEKLSDENTSLSNIIHLDNQIIQTIEAELNKLSDTELTNKLLISINQRNDYVNSVLIKSKNLASTGNAGVDAVLLDLYIKAASRGIDFNLNTDCDINYLINNIITNNDFEALLRELITNSIIAVENNPKTTGRISINISQPNDIYELTVMDNGSFIDNNSIYDIIEKSKASITTNHFENNDSFTKSITIRFDGLNMSERIFSKQRHTI